MTNNNLPNNMMNFNDWYAQVEGASDIDIQVLMTAFNEGVTPEEMNAR